VAALGFLDSRGFGHLHIWSGDENEAVKLHSFLQDFYQD
jgi:hypothetical protein